MAMEEAAKKMGPVKPDYLLVDGNAIPEGVPIEVEGACLGGQPWPVLGVCACIRKKKIKNYAGNDDHFHNN